MTMERTSQQWAAIDPSAVAAGSQAQAFYCIQDAQRDIATLTTRAERAEAALEGARGTLRAANEIADHMVEEIGRLQAKNAELRVENAGLREDARATARAIADQLPTEEQRRVGTLWMRNHGRGVDDDAFVAAALYRMMRLAIIEPNAPELAAARAALSSEPQAAAGERG